MGRKGVGMGTQWTGAQRDGDGDTIGRGHKGTGMGIQWDGGTKGRAWGYNGTGAQRDGDGDTMGLGHKGTERDGDGDTLGLGHKRTERDGDGDTMGLGYSGTEREGMWIQWDWGTKGRGWGYNGTGEQWADTALAFQLHFDTFQLKRRLVLKNQVFSCVARLFCCVATCTSLVAYSKWVCSQSAEMSNVGHVPVGHLPSCFAHSNR